MCPEQKVLQGEGLKFSYKCALISFTGTEQVRVAHGIDVAVLMCLG